MLQPAVTLSGEFSMEETKTEERRQVSEELEIVRAKLRATGATVLSPTTEWAALRKQMLLLTKKLK
jgi:hypothetical protein